MSAEILLRLDGPTKRHPASIISDADSQESMIDSLGLALGVTTTRRSRPGTLLGITDLKIVLYLSGLNAVGISIS